MKRIITAVVLVALTLTGCNAKAKTAPKATASARLEQTVPPKQETPKPATPPKQEATQLTEPAAPEATEDTAPPAPEVTEEASTKQETTQPPKQEVSTPAAPAKQEQPKPAAPAQPAAPSGSSKSRATCKDTGSSAIWEDPDKDKPQPYEETDPTRQTYMNYLKEDGNPYYFWVEEESMLMYLGHTYGIPLYTSYEIAAACTWSSSDPSVATVNQAGFVEPLKEGTVTVTITHVDPETQIPETRKCEITVRSYPSFTIAELEQRAHEEAKLIADYALNYPGADTDLKKISIAAGLVHEYVKIGRGSSVTKIENGQLVSYSIPGYNQPFGTLVTFHSSCAGDTRALGLVLEYMGFEWYHTNENQWDHQWCVVYNVDGQTAFADSSAYGIVGYGQRQEDRSNWMWYRGGDLVSFS